MAQPPPPIHAPSVWTVVKACPSRLYPHRLDRRPFVVPHRHHLWTVPHPRRLCPKLMSRALLARSTGGEPRWLRSSGSPSRVEATPSTGTIVSVTALRHPRLLSQSMRSHCIFSESNNQCHYSPLGVCFEGGGCCQECHRTSPHAIHAEEKVGKIA